MSFNLLKSQVMNFTNSLEGIVTGQSKLKCFEEQSLSRYLDFIIGYKNVRILI